MFFSVFFVFNQNVFSQAEIYPEQISKPIFDSNNNLFYAYKNSENQIILKKTIFSTQEVETYILPLESNSFSPHLEKDRNQQIWLVWEERESSQSTIMMAKIKEQSITDPRVIGLLEGFNYSPDLCFDSSNSPWVVWINYTETLYRIIVKEISTGKIWQMNTASTSTALNPRIITVAPDTFWIFWSGRDRGEEEIFYRTFSQEEWAPPSRIIRNPKFPNVNFDVDKDQNNTIWIVWSGYNGLNYDIFCSYWNSRNWTHKTKISGNFPANNSFPSLAIVNGLIPVVTWLQSPKRGYKLCVTVFENGYWDEKKMIFRGEKNSPIPHIVSKEDKIGFIWLSQNEIKSNIFYLDQLERKRKGPLRLPFSISSTKTYEDQIIYNPSLSENKYIGLGDSITYGVIGKLKDPKLGYIPRLENILSLNFGETEVINEGRSGERTYEGLARTESVIAGHLAKYLLLMEGTNDVHFIGKISVETTAFNLREIVRKCLLFGVFPAIATIPPRLDNNIYETRIQQLNQLIFGIAQDLAIPIVDQFSQFFEYPQVDGGLQSLLSDGVHPSAKGYQFMAETWWEEIKNFPFAPTNISVSTALNEILFFSEQGNHISWEQSPKIFDISLIQGYRLYRKKLDSINPTFQLLQFISGQFEYFDKEIDPLENYIYAISTLRKDNVEGPILEK